MEYITTTIFALITLYSTYKYYNTAAVSVEIDKGKDETTVNVDLSGIIWAMLAILAGYNVVGSLIEMI